MNRLKRYKKKLRLKLLHNGFELGCSLDGEYLVTTDLGILHLIENRGRLLTSRPGYGIAINGNEVFFSFENLGLVKNEEMASFVIRANLEELLNGSLFKYNALKSYEKLYVQPFPSPNGRVHQLAYCSWKKTLLVASSQNNSIVEIDLTTGEGRLISPFLDKFGVPIRYDHNHINSVLPIEDAVYFVSYKTGGKSLVGYLHDGHGYGWHVGPVGFHDIFPTRDGFICCDTFGDLEHGRVLTESGDLLKEFFLDNDYAPRGAAGNERETLIGHSHKGPRSKRFKGFGGLIRIWSNANPEYIKLPVAQVYQIMQVNGEHFVSPKTVQHEAFKALLNSRFGEPVALGPYIEEPV